MLFVSVLSSTVVFTMYQCPVNGLHVFPCASILSSTVVFTMDERPIESLHILLCVSVLSSTVVYYHISVFCLRQPYFALCQCPVF